MAESRWNRSHWILVVVALLAIGVVIAKQTTRSAAKRLPATAGPRAHTDNPVLQTAGAVGRQQPEGQPERSPATPTTAPPATRPKAERAAAVSPLSTTPKSDPAPAKPTAPPAPAAPPAAEPPAAAVEQPVKMAEPLPGSQFADCLNSGRPTIADFGAGWCKPCKMMEPVLKQAAGKHEGKLNIVFVNTDEYPQVAKEYGIRAIPTQVFLDKKGKEVGRHMGYYPLAEFEADMRRFGVIE